MALIGKIPKFDSHDNDWLVFTERLEQFFELNDLSEEKKKAILITNISDDVYKSLLDVCQPNLPKAKTFDELCKLLTSVFRERVTNVEENEMSDESIANYFARINKWSGKCGHKGGPKGHRDGHKGHKGIHKHHMGGHIGMRSRCGPNHHIHRCGRNGVIC